MNKKINTINRIFDTMTIEDQSTVISDLTSKMVPKRVKAGELVIVIVKHIPRWGICIEGGPQLKVWLYPNIRTTFTYVYWYKLIYQTNELYDLEIISDHIKVIKKEEIDSIKNRVLLKTLPKVKKGLMVSYNNLFGVIIKDLKDEGFVLYFEDDSIKLVKKDRLKYYKGL